MPAAAWRTAAGEVMDNNWVVRDPGALRHKILIQIVTAPFGQDGVGSNPTTFATTYAEITVTGGSREDETLGRQKAVENYEIWIRYIPGLTAFMQIYWVAEQKTLVQTDTPTDPDQRKNWLILHAKETSRQNF